jgi:hydrogenase-4 transcriptional activator
MLLEIWREVCRHIEINEAVERIAPLLRAGLPVRSLLVRQIDVERMRIETIAAGSVAGAPPLRSRTELNRAQLADLLAWGGAGRVRAGRAGQGDALVDLLAPAGETGDVIVGPLSDGGEVAGVLVLVGERHAFDGSHAALAQELVEPLGVALANDTRLHELNRLRSALEADKQALLSRLGRQEITDAVVGSEAGLRNVMARVEQVAAAEVPVLLLGETGTGKEVIAREIHRRSPRASGPVVRVNCGAIPPGLIDSELFGHERGSFTGAVTAREGWFERADGGTLFLDEIGELPLDAQVRLLRVLQDGTFERVGGHQEQRVDVRMVAATHRDLHAMVLQRTFREDLWYRIGVFPIRLPPLRERLEDIPPLAAHFAARAGQRLGSGPLALTSADQEMLIGYPWPGNVRELGAVIERAAILGGGRRLEIAAALGVGQVEGERTPVPAAAPAPARIATLDEATARHIERALAETRGRIEGPTGAAALLGINPHTLRARMRKLGVQWSAYRMPRAL